MQGLPRVGCVRDITGPMAATAAAAAAAVAVAVSASRLRFRVVENTAKNTQVIGCVWDIGGVWDIKLVAWDIKLVAYGT